jgi:hypothetical protein
VQLTLLANSGQVLSLMSITAAAALVGLTPPGVLVVAPAAVPLLGAVPLSLAAGGIYPTTQAEILALTHLQILNLMEWYNEDFGILPGDPIGVRCNKVGHWIHRH